MKKAKLKLNVDCKPSFVRIPKNTEVEVVEEEMPNWYVMVEYKGMCLPVPKSSLIFQKENI